MYIQLNSATGDNLNSSSRIAEGTVGSNPHFSMLTLSLDPSSKTSKARSTPGGESDVTVYFPNFYSNYHVRIWFCKQWFYNIYGRFKNKWWWWWWYHPTTIRTNDRVNGQRFTDGKSLEGWHCHITRIYWSIIYILISWSLKILLELSWTVQSCP